MSDVETVTVETIRHAMDILYVRNDIQYEECQESRGVYCHNCKDKDTCDIRKAKSMIINIYKNNNLIEQESENGNEKAQ